MGDTLKAWLCDTRAQPNGAYHIMDKSSGFQSLIIRGTKTNKFCKQNSEKGVLLVDDLRLISLTLVNKEDSVIIQECILMVSSIGIKCCKNCVWTMTFQMSVSEILQH